MTRIAPCRSTGPLFSWALPDRSVAFVWFFGSLTVAMIAGCGGGPLHPVEGTVTYSDGSPVTGGNVVFSSVDQQPPVSAQGAIGGDGTFRLGTKRPADGAPVGKYRAVVSEPIPADMDSPPAPTIHPRFGDFNTSGLEFEVAPGANEFTIVVERPAGARGGEAR